MRDGCLEGQEFWLKCSRGLCFSFLAGGVNSISIEKNP